MCIRDSNDTFTFALEFRAAPSDWDGDGMPNTYEDGHPGVLSPTNAADGGAADHDGDRVPNVGEYVARTDPDDPGSFPAADAVASSPTGIVVRFATAADRVYRVWWTDASLTAPAWTLATTNGLPGTGGWVQWLDDGTLTAPAPALATQRTYRIEVRLP